MLRAYPFPMPTPDDLWETLFAGLIRLRDAWPNKAWTYDRRLRCVSSSFPTASEPGALAAMAEVLPTAWTSESVAGAADDIRTVTEACGGLRTSQKIYWGTDATAPGAFGLWWPWGDGTTISLRIGLHHLDEPKRRYPRLRDVFGIPQAPVE